MDDINLKTAFSEDKVVGCRQVEKGLALGTIRCAYVARDTDAKLKRRLKAKISAAGVQLFEVSTKEELGVLAGVEVPTAVVGIVKRQLSQEGDAI